MQSTKLRLYVFGLVVLAGLAFSPAAQAQTTWYVPDDIPTLQDAAFLAAPGDTIILAEGEHCGAFIPQPLNIMGASASKSRIVGCPFQSPEYVAFGKTYLVGLLMAPDADGSTISHLTFDGSNWINDNDELGLGIWAPFFTGTPNPTADNMTIEHNRFLGGVGPMIIRGSGNTISHNVFDGYTIDNENGIGGWGIEMISVTWFVNFLGIPPADVNPFPPTAGNSVTYNQFRTTVRDGVDQPWLSEFPDVTFVGIATGDQADLLVRGNKFDIAPDSTGTLFGAGVIATDAYYGGQLTDAVVVKNDGRGSQYSIIITRDRFGGTANTTGAVIRGNFGLNSINEVESDISNRSISTLLECDEFGACQ